MKNLFLVLGLVCLCTTLFSQTKPNNLANGFYIVSERTPGKSVEYVTGDTTTTALKFNALFKENAPDATGTLQVFKNNFVPLEFSKEPTLVKQSDGSKRLHLFLSKSSAEKQP